MKRRAWRKTLIMAAGAVFLSFSLASPILAETVLTENAEEIELAGENDRKFIEDPIESAKNGIVKLYAYFVYTDDASGEEKRELKKECTGCIISGVSGNKIIITSYKGLVPTKKQKKKYCKEKGLEKISEIDVEYILYHNGGDIRLNFDDSKSSGDIYESKDLCIFSLNSQLEEQVPLRLGADERTEKGAEVNVVEFEEKSRNTKYDIESTVVHTGTVIDSNAIWNYNGDNRYISHNAEFTDLGGALIDVDGYLIGMNSVQGDYENYSLSVEEIRKILDDRKCFYYSRDKDEAMIALGQTRAEAEQFFEEKKKEAEQIISEADKIVENSDYTKDTIKLYQMLLEEIKSEFQQTDNPIIRAQVMASDEEYSQVLEALELAEKTQIEQIEQSYILQEQNVQKYVEQMQKKLKEQKKILKKKVSKWFIVMIVLAVLDAVFIVLTVLSVLKTRKLRIEVHSVNASEREPENPPERKEKRKKKKKDSEDANTEVQRQSLNQRMEDNYPQQYREPYTGDYSGTSKMSVSSMNSGQVGQNSWMYSKVPEKSMNANSYQSVRYDNWPTSVRQTISQEEFMRFQLQRYEAALIWHTQGKRKLISITKPTFIIGKNPESVDCAIPGNNSISRTHITIRWENECYYVYDMNSVNGTFINGRRIGTNGVRINSGDQLNLANETFEFLLKPKGMM